MVLGVERWQVLAIEAGRRKTMGNRVTGKAAIVTGAGLARV
ncbi:MAG: hypothetical protein DDT27_00437 [Dehalococcoidia bacterium]|nr:hypothetical protein [Chloroflexota bacterium]